MTIDDRQKTKITVGDFAVSRYDENTIWVQQDLKERGFRGICVPDNVFVEVLDRVLKEKF